MIPNLVITLVVMVLEIFNFFSGLIFFHIDNVLAATFANALTWLFSPIFLFSQTIDLHFAFICIQALLIFEIAFWTFEILLFARSWISGGHTKYHG